LGPSFARAGRGNRRRKKKIKSLSTRGRDLHNARRGRRRGGAILGKRVKIKDYLKGGGGRPSAISETGRNNRVIGQGRRGRRWGEASIAGRRATVT